MIAEPIVEAHELSYTYPHPTVEALQRVTVAIAPGTFTAIIGPNGSGKTTFLRLMIGLLEPTSGTIQLMGRTPAETPDVVQRHVGYVPQYESINLRLPVRSRDIVEMGIAARAGDSMSGRQIMRRVEQALELVDLARVRDRRYSSLSGGQRQRVLLARALAVDPDILVLDEPFSGMDIVGQRSVAEFLARLVREKGLTVITVAHNVSTLVHFIDNVLLLNGELVAFGPPNEVLKPETLRRGYGAKVPIIVCEEGYPHPIMEDSHG